MLEGWSLESVGNVVVGERRYWVLEFEEYVKVGRIGCRSVLDTSGLHCSYQESLLWCRLRLEEGSDMLV